MMNRLRKIKFMAGEGAKGYVFQGSGHGAALRYKEGAKQPGSVDFITIRHPTHVP